MSARFHLVPGRFSENPAGMIRFLETLGLRTVSQPGGAGVAILPGRSGKAAVHPAAHSATGHPSARRRIRTSASSWPRSTMASVSSWPRPSGRRLDRFDEDETLALHMRVRSARNKYVGQYRRTASARVTELGGRGVAAPKNRRAALKAEAFE
jgi:hypothetical protein